MEMELEDLLMQIRNKLQTDKIKLWLEPYYKDNKTSDKDLQNLARIYSEYLYLPYESCLMALIDLQKNSLERLKQRDHFNETGVATLKIRVSSEYSNANVFNIELFLTNTGAELKNIISARIDLPSNRIKLIANGKIIDDNQVLEYQNIKHGTQIMALVLCENPTQIEAEGNQLRELETIKADTQLLASNSSSLYMNLEDQSGNAITLPDEEKKSLMVAMALHEKGRAALKNDDYSSALVMFLDADKEFCRCNSSILEAVDNYALLNLDIVWCYLCLKSVSQIPEAEERLKKCEQNFHRSYGQNLERLMALKGTTGNEAALFMRLHLLQAIIKYHQNKRNEALSLLLRAEEELKVMKIDESSLMALAELGFTVAEARLGLRATQGNVNAAAEYINTNREQRANSRKKALEEFVLNSERRKLGKCADGKQYVEPKFVKMLQNMGYTKETARLALQQSNNDVSMSVQIIQDNPHLLNVASTSSSNSFTHLIRDMAPHLEAAGFNTDMVRQVLQSHNGDVLAAVDELCQSNGMLDLAPEEAGMSATQLLDKKQKEEEALNRLQNVIPMVDDDHLDLTLEQEEIFLNQYKKLLLPE